MMNKAFQRLRPNIVTEKVVFKDEEFENIGLKLQTEVSSLFGRSLAIRELDSGSDNAAEIELNNLNTPHYDIERFGISFVASPRHADVLIITGAVTHNMEIAARKTYDAMPHPKFVVAVGDDACNGGIFQGTYAVNGGADRVLPVDLKITGNPPSPLEIMKGLLQLMAAIRHKSAGS
ncbi:MAG: NADH-quinone oxidoreductase subunit B family protein [Dehalococcoidales bacterium]|nr:NADH-quinone oxidoreductase subunit B family protein [Dehalococcoidales bacterium]